MFLRVLSWCVIIVRAVCSSSWYNCNVRNLCTILYYKSSSDLCAVYYDYFAALTQILRAPCNIDEIGGSRHFPLPVAPQEPMGAFPIRRLLTPVTPSHPCTIRSIYSVCPNQPVASPFLPLYQPAHNNLISPIKPD